MTDDTLTEIQNALIRRITPWVIAGLVGSGLMGSTGLLRIDKFGRTDFQVETEAHNKAMHLYVDREIKHAVILLKAEMPPERTKKRIRAIERYLELTNPDFEAESGAWQ